MSRSSPPFRSAQERVAVALDTADWEQFRGWCGLFGPHVGCLKVGLEAYVRWGPRATEAALESGADVFLDLKLHDIPNTVAGAVSAARALGVRWVTVHAGGGRAQLVAAAEAAGPGLGILAVTVLTSLDADELARLQMPGDPADRVSAWAALAREAGCAGVVSSAREASGLRRVFGDDGILVTPGIRFAGDDPGDQRRVASPASAIADGADLLVVGRPLTRAPDPQAALTRLFDEIAEAER